MNEELTLRAARAGDREAIHRLLCALEEAPLPRDRFDAIFDAQLGREGYRCFVAERDGRVVGMLNLRIEPQLHHCAPVAEILELVVDAEFRGQAIGAGLLERAMVAAGEAGCVLLEVACNIHREAAHRFYIREGMAPDHLRFMREL